MREDRRNYRQKEVEDNWGRGWTRGYGGQEEVKDKRKWQTRWSGGQAEVEDSGEKTLNKGGRRVAADGDKPKRGHGRMTHDEHMKYRSWSRNMGEKKMIAFMRNIYSTEVKYDGNRNWYYFVWNKKVILISDQCSLITFDRLAWNRTWEFIEIFLQFNLDLSTPTQAVPTQAADAALYTISLGIFCEM